MTFGAPSDQKEIKELNDKLEELTDNQLYSNNSGDNNSPNGTFGRRNTADGRADGVRGNTPRIHQVTENDETGTPTGVFNRINLVTTLVIIEDLASSSISLKYVNGKPVPGSTLKVIAKAGKTLIIETGGDFDVSTPISVSDSEYIEFIFFSEAETGITGGAFKIIKAGTSEIGDNLGNHTAIESLKMQDNAIFLDTTQNQSIIALALANNYVVPVGGAHDFFVNDTIIPKFGITETSIESNVPLNMNSQNVIGVNDIIFENGQTIQSDINGFDYRVFSSARHDFFINDVRKLRIENNFVTFLIDIIMEGNSLILDADNDTEINSFSDDNMQFIAGGELVFSATTAALLLAKDINMFDNNIINIGKLTGVDEIDMEGTSSLIKDVSTITFFQAGQSIQNKADPDGGILYNVNDIQAHIFRSDLIEIARFEEAATGVYRLDMLDNSIDNARDITFDSLPGTITFAGSLPAIGFDSDLTTSALRINVPTGAEVIFTTNNVIGSTIITSSQVKSNLITVNSSLLIGVLGGAPIISGQFTNNGTDTFVFSGGTVRNLSDIGGSSQTPIIQDVDYDGFDIKYISNIEFRTTTGAPSTTIQAIWATTTDMIFNVPTDDEFSFRVNGVDKMIITNNSISMIVDFLDILSSNIINISDLLFEHTGQAIISEPTGLEYRTTDNETHIFFIDGIIRVVLTDTIFGISVPLNMLSSNKIINVLDPTNAQDVVTKAYGDANYGGGANTSLSNLFAVAINTSLISDTAGQDSLGSINIPWSSVYSQRVQFIKGTGITNDRYGIARISGDILEENVPLNASYTWMIDGVIQMKLDTIELFMNSANINMDNNDIINADNIGESSDPINNIYAKVIRFPENDIGVQNTFNIYRNVVFGTDSLILNVPTDRDFYIVKNGDFTNFLLFIKPDSLTMVIGRNNSITGLNLNDKSFGFIEGEPLFINSDHGIEYSAGTGKQHVFNDEVKILDGILMESDIKFDDTLYTIEFTSIQTTATTGSGGSLPSLPIGYFRVKFLGDDVMIPFYNP